MTEPQVFFEDDYLLAIDKPSGMVVNRGFGAESETIQDWVERNFQFARAYTLGPRTAIFNFQDLRSGIVHRLDKETSGVLLVAKTQEVFWELQRQFKDREVKKVYVAMVHGVVDLAEGAIEAPLGRNPKNRKRFAVVEGGREAKTRYKVIAHFNARQLERGVSSANTKNYTLLELYPETGRTHQIRVHLKHIGHPVVGDMLYAGRKTARRDRHWCPRLFLHAKSITFTHPATGKTMTIEVPLSKELEEVLEVLAS